MKKTALITGGTSGIGLNIAKSFANKGYRLILNGLEDNGKEIAAQLANSYTTEVVFFNFNLSDSSQVTTLSEESLKAFSKIDVLVNNAGVQYVSPIEDFPLEKWNLILSVNLTSAFILSKAFWNSMKENKYGRIINIASAHGLTASEYKSAYVASKHGIIGLTKVLALEGAPYGITCNAICPGYVKTPLVEKQIVDQAKAHGISEKEVETKIMLAKQPLKEFINADSISDMCLFLASENANQVTGSSISLDGGWTAQ
ncbi:MAG: 3-hydroxybutyrate dehydrogenase [Bacteroidia bacterium]|jgi:3-hydroxybutyrate dehydrogenase